MLDEDSRTDLEYILGTAFHHEPAGIRSRGDFAGEEYEEFWWRTTNTNDGYVMVWWDGNSIRSFHTYRYPPDVYGE